MQSKPGEAVDGGGGRRRRLGRGRRLLPRRRRGVEPRLDQIQERRVEGEERRATLLARAARARARARARQRGRRVPVGEIEVAEHDLERRPGTVGRERFGSVRFGRSVGRFGRWHLMQPWWVIIPKAFNAEESPRSGGQQKMEGFDWWVTLSLALDGS